MQRPNALGEWTPKRTEIALKMKADGYSHRAIAERFGVNIKTVYGKLRQAERDAQTAPNSTPETE
jgi:transposase